MKLIALVVLNLACLILEGGNCTAVDPFNVTCVQPSAKLFPTPFDQPLIYSLIVALGELGNVYIRYSRKHIRGHARPVI